MKPEPRSRKEKSRRVAFTFEGKDLSGFEGEPIASALFRAGIRTLSYSLKYHRPRSIHCARGRCGMCHVEVNGFPGVPACTTPLADGMRIRCEDFRPVYGKLAGAAFERVELPAGFYYRMLNRPAFLRKLFMKRIRSMSGVGRVTEEKGELPSSGTDLSTLKGHYDVVVVGAGISGMAAAEAASGQGCSVLLVDEYEGPGGNSAGFQADRQLASALEQASKRLRAQSGITASFLTTAHGFYPPDTVLLGSAGAMRRIQAKAFIFSVGCYDVIPLFGDNELPGIFGERGMRLFLERDGLVPGKHAVVYGELSRAQEVAQLLDAHGIEVRTIVDPAGGTSLEGEAKAREAAGGAPAEEPPPVGGTFAGIGSARVIGGMRITEARGEEWLESIVLSTKGNGGAVEHVECDLLVCAFRGQPAYELPYQAGFRFELDTEGEPENRVMLPTSISLVEDGSPCFLAGGVTGETDWKRKIEQGRHAGESAALAQ